ncbi:MAG TPA: BrnA antitoxin family protein [Candidatus Dormibacteraeota bacterium]|nr:BrnA antitoxin family protein [Candidatus Dormibacteraeota bacterium]HVA11299.1 BrnA antitoxin family protein [Candidatus Dormibacteraeota bacterium]
MKKLKTIPDFKNDEEEAEFWDTHSTADYIDWSKAEETIFPNLKLSTESISMRLPAPLLAHIKSQANEKGVPYQSLMKVYLSEKVDEQLQLSLHR